MHNPKVSVIIPVYKQSEYLAEALLSVLHQTYENFEVVVVNDASPDDTDLVVKQFSDDRLIYLTHEDNRGLPAARNTGILASSGEIIALLDADDYFHKEKLQTHVTFLKNHPDVGVSYNARFNLNYSSNTIRSLTRPPLSLSLADLVLGFPFTPSDMVIRREWISRVNFFDDSLFHYSEDLDINCRLALDGCKFKGIDRAINFRRLHSNRVIRDIPERLNNALQVLEKTFVDPRCPAEVIRLRNKAFANHYLVWSYQAYLQGETQIGKEYLRQAAQISPSIFSGNYCEYMNFLSEISVADINIDHEKILHNIGSNLPAELTNISSQLNESIARGYLRKAVRGVMWGPETDKIENFFKAAQYKLDFDETILRQINRELVDYYVEFGIEPTKSVIESIRVGFDMMGKNDDFQFIHHCFVNDRVFRYYRHKEYAEVVKILWEGFWYDSKILNNRGLISIFFRSLVNRLFGGLKTG